MREAKFAGVDSMSLRPGQIAQLRQQLLKQQRYLYRLCDRMRRTNFPEKDPMWVYGLRAREAVEDLLRSIPVKPLREGSKDIGR